MMKNSPKLIILLTSIFVYGANAEVVFKDNGYSGLMIAIHEDISENPTLLESIKTMITKASHNLYSSTNQMAFFRQATIVVPPSWSMSSNYASVPNVDYLSTAEVRIAPPDPSYGNVAYTLQLGECGERGQYIHLTPDFLMEINPKTNAINHDRNARIFKDEWDHLRYGVFKEYGERGNKKFPIFYKDENDKIRVNVCSENVKGWIRRSDGISPCKVDVEDNLIIDCTFYPAQIRTTNGSPTPELDTQNQVCNDKIPWIKAANTQYRMCNNRSVSDVILSNDDFKYSRKSSLKPNELNPEINVVQRNSESASNVVLVLDISYSMNRENRLKSLRDATSRLINFHIKETCNIRLGMVSFSNSSTILANLTTVGKSNGELIKKIPKSASGTTSIGSGIRKGLQVLNQSGESLERSKLILLSDGEENSGPYVKDVTEEITQAKVVIYTVAIGKNASRDLETLSKMTGGRTDVFNPTYPVKTMDSILSSIILEAGCNDAIINSNRRIMVPKKKNVEETFDVDNSLQSTIVFITYDPSKAIDGDQPMATLTNPSGKTLDHKAPECILDAKLGVIQFRLSNVQPGKWNIQIENLGSDDLEVNTMITSDLKTDAKNQTNSKPIHVKSWLNSIQQTFPNLPKVFADIAKGDQHVIRANVTATVYRPDGTGETIVLQDNGQGADRIPDDGVYTEFFTRFNGDGRYQIDIDVRRTNQTRISDRKQAEARQREPVKPIIDEEMQGDQPRAEFAISELPKVNEIFDSSAIYGDDEDDDLDLEGLEPIEPFQRFTPAGTFIMKNWSAKDLIPPAKITDLTVLSTNLSARTIRLRWTSSGDDMHDGQATTLELRYHQNPTFLLNSFKECFTSFKILQGNLDPLPAYVKHTVVIQMPPEKMFSINKSDRKVYFAARFFDEASNAGEVSNVVIADFSSQSKHRSTSKPVVGKVVTATSSPIKGNKRPTTKSVVGKATTIGSRWQRQSNPTTKPVVGKVVTTTGFPVQEESRSTEERSFGKVNNAPTTDFPLQEKPARNNKTNVGQFSNGRKVHQSQPTNEPEMTSTMPVHIIVAITVGSCVVVVLVTVTVVVALKKLGISSVLAAL